MTQSNPSFLPIGGTFNGRYTVERCIAAGGMGAVYEVQHIETRRRRAMKVMLPSVVSNPDLRARFRREATVAADIETEHIAEVLDAGVDDESGVPFIVMELLKGEELGAMVARCGPLPPEEAVTYVWQAALALDKTHAHGIVHRDLKPENLFVTYRDDGSPRVKILDFGIAKVLEGDKDVKATRGVLGTPLYITPEQVQSPQDIGPATDAFSLSHIAYTLLVGEPYWSVEEQESETVYQLLVRIVQPIPEMPSLRARRRGQVELPPAFDAWFQKATALATADRFPGALATVRALADALGVWPPALGARDVNASARFAAPGGGGAVAATTASPRVITGTGQPRDATVVASPHPVAAPSATAAELVSTVAPVERKRSRAPLVLAALLLAGGGAAAAVVLTGGKTDGAVVAPAAAPSAAVMTAASAMPAASASQESVASASASASADASTSKAEPSASVASSAPAVVPTPVANTTPKPPVNPPPGPTTTGATKTTASAAAPACTLVVCKR